MFVKAQYFRPAGLGNKLFPWARAVIIADKYDYTVIDPIWFSPRGAGITRGGVDYKKAFNKIWLFNNFRKRKKDASFIRGFFLNKNSIQICEGLSDAINLINSGTKKNILFNWVACHEFTDLGEYREFINRSLLEITRKKSIAFADQFNGKDFIGLNIRTGKDFVSAASGKKGYFLTEIDWFIHALKGTREKMGNLPAIIVSDGGPKELAKILKEPGTTLLNSSNAIEDLLVLSKSKVFLGSGNSSFSAWASFLGGMDTYSSAETPFAHFKINSGKPSQIISTIN